MAVAVIALAVTALAVVVAALLLLYAALALTVYQIPLLARIMSRTIPSKIALFLVGSSHREILGRASWVWVNHVPVSTDICLMNDPLLSRLCFGAVSGTGVV